MQKTAAFRFFQLVALLLVLSVAFGCAGSGDVSKAKQKTTPTTKQSAQPKTPQTQATVTPKVAQKKTVEVLPGKYGKFTSYNQQITLDPVSHQFTSKVVAEWERGLVDTVTFVLHANMKITNARLMDVIDMKSLKKIASGKKMGPAIKALGIKAVSDASAEHLALYASPISGLKKGDKTEINLEFSGEIFDDIGASSFSRWAIEDETTGLIGEKGAFLTPETAYYPRLAGDNAPATFKTTITVPTEWKALVEGSLLSSTDSTYTYDSKVPIDGSYLVAGPYKLESFTSDGIEIAFYYYEGSEDLVRDYLGFSARYVKMYNEMFGPYPFDRFSVVENFFPTGYGMPSYTLLGSMVLRLPHIKFTSLGHEVCHNWWGNGVFVDYDKGNWCEGLTVYSADYHYKQSRSPEQGAQYRMETLRDYSEYIIRGDKQDFPLRTFIARTEAGSRTIGYGKSMMVFHMLQQKIGEQKFQEGLKTFFDELKFQKATWDDIFTIMERVSGEKLEWFKNQWLDRTGAVSLELVDATTSEKNGKYEVAVTLSQVQSGDLFRVDVPVLVTFKDKTTDQVIIEKFDKKSKRVNFTFDKEPVKVEIDPGFDIFRSLDVLESAPVLAGYFGDEKPFVVIPDTSGEMTDAYRALAEVLVKRSKGKILTESEALAVDLGGKSVVWMGKKERGVKLAGTQFMLDGNALDGDELAVVYTWRDDKHPEKTQVDIWAESPGALQPLQRKLPHYGKYSYLAFSAGQNISKGFWPVEKSPLAINF